MKILGLKVPVLVALAVLALAMAVVNNLANRHSVPWWGSPEVFPKPADLAPTGGMAKGLGEGLAYGYGEFRKHAWGILGGTVIVLLLAAGLVASGRARARAVSMSLLRIGMGLMFLAAAWPKVADPKAFSTVVAQYQFLPAALVYPFGLALPALEFLTGLGVIFTKWEREFSAVLAFLFAIFLVALGQALWRDLGITCGCFDIEMAETQGQSFFSFIRDIVLLPVTLAMVAVARERPLWRLRD